ncbi:NfeD family protein [Anabaena sp. UHCC 0253]|nr:NfeD family protein [Anabaena sp. UHCC 0204]MTJ51237.1 NfeD family protein [Anabaena sp. UHCC 0253]
MMTTESGFLFTPPWFWLISGLVLIIGDILFFKKLSPNFRFIGVSMGVGAIFVATVLWRSGIYFGIKWEHLMYDEFETQIFYWMGVSLSLIIWIRPVLIPRKKFTIQAAQEATTLTEILPGKPGRVLYEGSSWQASCANAEGAIAADQKVYVLRREGNTLIVASEAFFNN